MMEPTELMTFLFLSLGSIYFGINIGMWFYRMFISKEYKFKE